MSEFLIREYHELLEYFVDNRKRITALLNGESPVDDKDYEILLSSLRFSMISLELSPVMEEG